LKTLTSVYRITKHVTSLLERKFFTFSRPQTHFPSKLVHRPKIYPPLRYSLSHLAMIGACSVSTSVGRLWKSVSFYIRSAPDVAAALFNSSFNATGASFCSNIVIELSYTANIVLVRLPTAVLAIGRLRNVIGCLASEELRPA